MAEPEKDDVGSTGDGLGDGVDVGGGRSSAARTEDEKDSGEDATADSKGTIGSGSEDADLTQASGGSVD